MAAEPAVTRQGSRWRRIVAAVGVVAVALSAPIVAGLWLGLGRISPLVSMPFAVAMALVAGLALTAALVRSLRLLAVATGASLVPVGLRLLFEPGPGRWIGYITLGWLLVLLFEALVAHRGVE